MHPQMTSDLAAQHRHDMTAKAAKASHATRTSQPTQLSRAAWASQATSVGRARRPGARLAGALLPRYRVSWSRTTLSAPGGDGRRARSLVIVISASRGL